MRSRLQSIVTQDPIATVSEYSKSILAPESPLMKFFKRRGETIREDSQERQNN
jgi:hypothetical protein